MRNILLRGFAAALVLALLCGGALAEVKTTGSVWMRSGPGLSHDQVSSIAEGKTLEYLGESSVDERGVTWYKVSDGKNTGWVSSKYSELVGEDEAPDEPDDEPEADEPEADEPEAGEAEDEPTDGGDLPTTLPALNAGLLFTDSVADQQEEPAVAEPAPALEEEEDEAGPASDRLVELSGYYLDNLVEAANAVGLISYRQVQSEAPFQYYDDSVILAGNQQVENVVVYGKGYEVYGVSVGMDVNAARACLNAAGLDPVDSGNGVTYGHRGTEASHFVDDEGHDSCINLWVDEDNIVTEIDWSSYTG